MFASILRKKKTKKKVQPPKQSHSFFLANWFGSDIAIDLGTANIIVFVKNRGIVVNEPAVIAVDTMENKVVAVGREAQAMLGRTPRNIQAYHPLRNGVIADYDATEYMLRYFIRKAIGKALIFKPRVVICVPSSVTNVERRAVIEAAMHAGVMAFEWPLPARRQSWKSRWQRLSVPVWTLPRPMVPWSSIWAAERRTSPSSA